MACSGIPEAAVIMLVMARQSGGFILICLAPVGCLEKLGGVIVITRCTGLCPPSSPCERFAEYLCPIILAERDFISILW